MINVRAVIVPIIMGVAGRLFYMDSRGVLRGECLVASCTCPRYQKDRAGRQACRRCMHPPAKHSKLETHGGSESSKHGEWSSPEKSDTKTLLPSTGHSCSFEHLHLERGRENCKAEGCSQKVYYEAGYGNFDYCSPECRNRHCLLNNREELQAALSRFTTISKTDPKCTKSSSLQERNIVNFHDIKRNELGLIIRMKQGIIGKKLVICGVKVGTQAHKKLVSKEIKLLSVITRINDKHISELPPRADFDGIVKGLDAKDLCLYLCETEGLDLDISKLCKNITKKYSCIVALCGHHNGGYGFSVDIQSILVRDNSCGLQSHDDIVAYNFVSTSGRVESLKTDIINEHIMSAAIRENKYLILFINRSRLLDKS